MNVTLRSVERGPKYKLVRFNGHDFVARPNGVEMKQYFNWTSAVRAAAQYESALGRPVRPDVGSRAAGVWVLRVD